MSRKSKWDRHQKWLEREARREEQKVLGGLLGSRKKKAEEKPDIASDMDRAMYGSAQITNIGPDTLLRDEIASVSAGIAREQDWQRQIIEQMMEERARRQVRYDDDNGKPWNAPYIEYVVEEYYDAAANRLKQRKVQKTPYLGEPIYKPAEKPENKVKAVVHKAGHFPIGWMIEASQRAQNSDDLIRIECEEEAVVIIAIAGDLYSEHRIAWLMMENAEVNPLILAIENVERQIRVQSSLKAANG